MSNMDAHPEATVCGGDEATVDAEQAGKRTSQPEHAGEPAPVEIITAREVPLGGPRAMTVRRTLPQRKRSMIGAWCFADHYGPDDVSKSGGMDVAPHPHIGLQTVSWLFDGEITHIDSGGNRGTVRPGEVNLMTSGPGICHSETSPAAEQPGAPQILHGLQLWVALPDSVRNTAPRAFEHHVPDVVEIPDATGAAAGSALVFAGELLGETSPITIHTPLVGVEIRVDAGKTITLDVNPAFEHGLLVDEGQVELEGVEVPRAAIGYTGIGASKLEISNAGDQPARMVLLGGEPFAEEIVMWWNFVGRSHEEIIEARKDWQARDGQPQEEIEQGRFGFVDGYVGHGGPNKNMDGMSWLPAPRLPNTTITPRQNPAPHARPDMPLR